MRAFPWPTDSIRITTALSRCHHVRHISSTNTSTTTSRTLTNSTPPILQPSVAVVVVNVVGGVAGHVGAVGVRPVIPLLGNPPSHTQVSRVRLGTSHLRSQPLCLSLISMGHHQSTWPMVCALITRPMYQLMTPTFLTCQDTIFARSFAASAWFPPPPSLARRSRLPYRLGRLCLTVRHQRPLHQ